MKRYFLIAALALPFAACGADARQDADTSNQTVDKSSAEVIAMPDQFRNVAHKCDGHGHRVYTNSTGGSGTSANIFVINDATCGR